jgi:uncharacterized membrane protein
MGASVEQFKVFTAGLLGLACLVAFLFLIDYAARLLRPASIAWHVAESAIAVIKAVYPESAGLEGDDETASLNSKPRAPDRVIRCEGRSETVVAVNLQALASEARRRGGLIEFVPHVGDFVAVDDPLFRLYGGTSLVPKERLHAAVAFGPERTMEQDPMFGFRILVDIALKALSKAINDPTTAVLALDQIHRLLRQVGKCNLRHERISDTDGRVLVLVPTPTWEDFVHIACREIRINAGENIQIPRRLRAMLENLLNTLPAQRHAALRDELELLDRTVEQVYAFPEDRALARAPDVQGMGAATVHADVKPAHPKAA